MTYDTGRDLSSLLLEIFNYSSTTYYIILPMIPSDNGRILNHEGLFFFSASLNHQHQSLDWATSRN